MPLPQASATIGRDPQRSTPPHALPFPKAHMRRVQGLVLAAMMSAGAFAQAPPTTDAKSQAPSTTDAKPAVVPNTIEQRVLACTICHGKNGEGIRKNEYNPR